MGDKLGSKVDCGLARIHNGVAWSNQCLLFSEKADHKGVTSTSEWVAPDTITFKIRTEVRELARARFMTLVALDGRWSPSLKQPPEGKYHCR
jgi:hypothetical protein